jgi:hypothetical protein
MPSAAIMPRRSSGEVSLRTSRTFSPLARGGFGAVGVEIHLAAGGAGTGGSRFGDALGGFDGLAIEHRGEHLVELIGRDAADGGLPVDEFFLFHFDGEADGGEAGAFAIAGLEHEDLAVLDGELEVLDILEVRFEGRRMLSSSV